LSASIRLNLGMLNKITIIFILLVALSACSTDQAQKLALAELKHRGLTYDLAGLKKSTDRIDNDGAFIFEGAGYFDSISDEDYKQLVIHTSKTNNFGLVSILLNNHKPVKFDQQELSNSLDLVLKQGFTRTLTLLIENGAELQPGSLLQSVYNDDYDFVTLVLDKGPMFQPGDYREALYVAGRIGHVNAIQAIFESNKAPLSAIESAMHGAAVTEEIAVIKYLVAQGIDINHRDKDGCTALHYLAQDGTVAMIKYMIESGAEINAECRGRETPLDWASYGKNVDVIAYLSDFGAVVY